MAAETVSDGDGVGEQPWQNKDDREPPSPSPHLLACESCRQRKVRCNRQNPCARCIRTHETCTYPAGAKPRQKRRSALNSAQLDEKLGEILGRLDSVQSFAKSLAYGHSHGGPSPTQLSNVYFSTPMSNACSPGDSAGNRALPSDSEYEGESSLSAHADYAIRFLQEAVKKNSSARSSSDIALSLEALTRTIDAGNIPDNSLQNPFPHAVSPPDPVDRNLPMPPLQTALSCLRMLTERPRVRYFWALEFQSTGQFTEYFLLVYASGTVNNTNLIIVNAGLYWLFAECDNETADAALKTEYKSYRDLCRNNLETLLSGLPFHLPSTQDVTLALSLAATYSLDKCRPLAAWNFIVAASHMSQRLGFHRAASSVAEGSETKGRKTRLFWVIYMLEKSLSLRLGRPSTIRDNDITIPLPGRESYSEGVVNFVTAKFIQTAQLQGRVYDEVYSPSALAQTGSTRTARAKALAVDVQRAHASETATDRQYMESRHKILGDSLHELLLRTQRVSYLSLLTLIYRSMPTCQEQGQGHVIGEDCIATAREALEEHMACVSLLNHQADSVLELYIHWALLASPFAPFTVVFCHVVQKSDSADIHRLGAVVETLQSIPSSFSDACVKQMRLFKSLYEVACKYVEVQANSQRSQVAGGIDAPNQEGMLLTPSRSQRLVDSPSTLGGPNPVNETVGPFPYFDEGSWTSDGALWPLAPELDPNGAQLGNWYYQNYQMFRMLENS